MNSSAAAVEAAVAEEVLVDNGPDTDTPPSRPEESDEPLRLSQAPPSPLPPLPSPLPNAAGRIGAPTEELEADPAPEPTEATDSACSKRTAPYSKLRSRAGETEVVVRDLTAAIDGDSVRVELLAPPAITDVVFSAAPSQSDEARPRCDKLRRLQSLTESAGPPANAAGKLDRAMKRERWLATYAEMRWRNSRCPAECRPYDPSGIGHSGPALFPISTRRLRPPDLRMKDAGPQAPGARFTRHSGARRGRCEHQAETRLKRSLTSLKRR
uniref:DUF4140 domain-containing protein n=1 Tax=Macrostomum lignano TaxID=282301 RepID=A0A1I8FAB6_9PLAT